MFRHFEMPIERSIDDGLDRALGADPRGAVMTEHSEIAAIVPADSASSNAEPKSRNLQKLERYAAIDHEVLVASGGDQMPPVPVHEIKR